MKIKIQDAICTLVEAVLPRGSVGQILHVRTDYEYRLETAAISDGKNIRGCFHFLFHRPNNYTKVLFCHDNSRVLQRGMKFVHKSDHDSCWRTDGVESAVQALHLDLCVMLIRRMEKKLGREISADEHRLIHCGQPGYSNLDVRVIEGTVESIPCKKDPYRDGEYLIRFEEGKTILRETEQ